MSAAPHVYVDADACPVKAETVKVAERHGLPVVFVANAWFAVPRAPRVRVQVVSGSFDAADDWIVGHAGPDDIVITADIPLASRCLGAGALVIGPTGKPFTEDNIGAIVATRNLLSELRGAGEITGGPSALSKQDRSLFLQQLDEAVQRVRRAQRSSGA